MQHERSPFVDSISDALRGSDIFYIPVHSHPSGGLARHRLSPMLVVRVLALPFFGFGNHSAPQSRLAAVGRLLPETGCHCTYRCNDFGSSLPDRVRAVPALPGGA